MNRIGLGYSGMARRNEELTQKIDVKVQNIKLSNGESYDFAEWTDIMMP